MKIAFLGPSLSGSEARGFTVLPPAQQGDVWRALRRNPSVIALIDGVFESRPSVWHHEILDALDAGVAVFGGASMGALRAAELHPFGMVGVGRIFRWYRDADVIDDGEVALLHAGAEHGWRPLTVPLVNIRWAASQTLRPRQARRVVEACARIFYQDRTWPRVLELLPKDAHRQFRALDLKAADAREVLRAAAASTSRPEPSLRRPPPSSLVRTRLGQPPNLLAGWARDLGLRVEVRPTRDLLALRRAEDEALERLVLDHAERMVNDGMPQPPVDRTGRGSARRRRSR
ncbi:MAG: TfuA-like protein [Myxococcales bacterium]